MSSHFFRKPPQNFCPKTFCNPKNFLTLNVFAGTFWLSVPSFRRETEQTTQIRKGKDYVRSSSEYHTVYQRRNLFRNHRIRHLWVRKRLRKVFPRGIRLRRSEDRPLSPKRNPKPNRLSDRRPIWRGPWLCLCPSKD